MSHSITDNSIIQKVPVHRISNFIRIKEIFSEGLYYETGTMFYSCLWEKVVFYVGYPAVIELLQFTEIE